MNRIGLALFFASAVVFGGMSIAAATTTGEFDNMCAEGLALHQKVETDCSVHATYGGKTYCFGNETARKIFFKHPETNLTKAEAYYSTLKK